MLTHYLHCWVPGTPMYILQNRDKIEEVIYGLCNFINKISKSFKLIYQM